MSRNTHKAGAAEPVAQLALLMEGAIVTAQFTKNTRAGVQAKLAATNIVDQTLEHPAHAARQT